MRASDYLKGWIACGTMHFAQTEDICLKSVYEGRREVLFYKGEAKPGDIGDDG